MNQDPGPDDLEAVIAACRQLGIDPVPIMVAELEAQGYTCTPPTTRPDWSRFGLVDADITTEHLSDTDPE